jgi:SAM-dependent methyltransferase
MFGGSTDAEWEKFGRRDPYFGVLADEKYRRTRLTDESRAEFFATGESQVEHVLDQVRRHVAPGFAPRRALDFGCGVGRLLVPLARHSEHVTGVDVSDAMLAEAARNCAAAGVRNITLVNSDPELSRLSGQYDFMHSFIVFQHIPVRRGAVFLRSLLQRLAPGGVAVLHFTYAKQSRVRRITPFLKQHVPFARMLLKLLRGERLRDPEMEMNSYDLNRLLFTFQQAGARQLFVECTDHAGDLGAVLYFRTPDRA